MVWFQGTRWMESSRWSLRPGGAQTMLYWCLLWCNWRGDRKARGDEMRKMKEGKRKIKVTREPLCPVANFHLFILWDFNPSTNPLPHISVPWKGNTKLVQDKATPTHLDISSYKLNINSAYCQWTQVKKVIYTGDMRAKEQKTMERMFLFLGCLSQHKCVSACFTIQCFHF